MYLSQAEPHKITKIHSMELPTNPLVCISYFVFCILYGLWLLFACTLLAVNVWVMPWWRDRGQTGNKFCSFCLPGKESLALSSSSLPFHEDDYWWYPNKQHPLLPCSNICRHTCHSICSVSSVSCSESNVNSFWGGDTFISVGIFCIVWTFSPKGKCVHFRCYGTVWQFCHNVMHHRMLWSVNNSRKRRTQLPCIQKEIRARSFHCFAKCHHQILNKFTDENR